MAARVLVALVEFQHRAGGAVEEGGDARRQCAAPAPITGAVIAASRAASRATSACISGSCMPAAIAPMQSSSTSLVRATTPLESGRTAVSAAKPPHRVEPLRPASRPAGRRRA